MPKQITLDTRTYCIVLRCILLFGIYIAFHCAQVKRFQNAHAVWYGMVWYGMVWYGMVWYGMAWHGMAWHGMV